MLKTLLMCLLLIIFTSCSNKNSNKIKEDRGQVLIDKILSDSLTLEEMTELIDNNNALDSLSFAQKKTFVMKLAILSGWERDEKYKELVLDSVIMNTNIREYIKLFWRVKE